MTVQRRRGNEHTVHDGKTKQNKNRTRCPPGGQQLVDCAEPGAMQDCSAAVEEGALDLDVTRRLRGAAAWKKTFVGQGGQ